MTLQFVVSVVFIQRHFEDVTEQMTRSVVLELRLSVWCRRGGRAAVDLGDARRPSRRWRRRLAFEPARRGRRPLTDARDVLRPVRSGR